MSDDCLKVTAHLTSPLAGFAPQLDALLEWAMSMHTMQAHEHRKVVRQCPAPPVAAIPIPLLRQEMGGWPVACCSAPILPADAATTVEHVCKKIAVEHSDLLHPDARKSVNTQSEWTKSYRIPLQIWRVDRVVWFARAHRKTLQKALRQVRAIGQKTSDSYGVVSEWEVEAGAPPAWWYAKAEGGGTVLMRALPWCEELPQDLVGARRTYGACCPPYWHRDRYGEIVVPL